MAIIISRHLALDEIVKLALEVDDVTWLVASEQTAEVDPDLASSGTAKFASTYLTNFQILWSRAKYPPEDFPWSTRRHWHD
jgi:hypothetical protein